MEIPTVITADYATDKSHTITDNYVPVASVIPDEYHAINVSIVRQNPRETGRPYNTVNNHTHLRGGLIYTFVNMDHISLRVLIGIGFLMGIILIILYVSHINIINR